MARQVRHTPARAGSQGAGEVVVERGQHWTARPAPRAVTEEKGTIMNSTVKDVMTTSVVAVEETASYKDIISALIGRRVSACPVLDVTGRVIGVVSEADLLLKELGPEQFGGRGASLRASGRRGEREKAGGTTAAELMSTPPVTISPAASVADAARLMHERGVKRLPVVDADGQLVGIVSRLDVLSVFTKPDDQIRDDVKKVIARRSALDRAAFGVTVASGIVTVTGQCDSRSVVLQLTGAIQHVEGVVGVRDRVRYPAETPAETAESQS
jgi:CBS domain-containing protein